MDPAKQNKVVLGVRPSKQKRRRRGHEDGIIIYKKRGQKGGRYRFAKPHMCTRETDHTRAKRERVKQNGFLYLDVTTHKQVTFESASEEHFSRVKPSQTPTESTPLNVPSVKSAVKKREMLGGSPGTISPFLTAF